MQKTHTPRQMKEKTVSPNMSDHHHHLEKNKRFTDESLKIKTKPVRA